MTALRFLGRFGVDRGQPLHFSATAAVVAATDHGATIEARFALKAMREECQVLAELHGRRGLDRRYVVAVVAVYVDAAVDAATFGEVAAAAGALGVSVETCDDLSGKLAKVLEVRSVESGGQRAHGYRFLLVLERGERSLFDAIGHDHIAGVNIPLIRNLATDIVTALGHLHGHGRIHADIKPLNVVCVGSTWQLIDMDVACVLGEGFGTKAPSSAYCPPEMAKVLLAATDGPTGAVDTAALGAYKADIAYDLWSLGVVLFHLLTGRSLWHANQADDVADLRALCAWQLDSLEAELATALRRPPTAIARLASACCASC